MDVRELREHLADLDDDTLVVLSLGNEVYSPAHFVTTHVYQPFSETEGGIGTYDFILEEIRNTDFKILEGESEHETVARYLQTVSTYNRVADPTVAVILWSAK